MGKPMLDLLGDLMLAAVETLAYRRERRRRRADHLPDDRCLDCDYSLVGTIPAGRTECPECGRPISPWQIARWKRRHRRNRDGTA